MPKTNCLTTSDLEVGMHHGARLSFSREQVRQYCALSGDYNAIHRNPEAARLRFPDAEDIIVPGGLIQISVTGIFGTEFPGDEIDVEVLISKIRGPMVEVDITLKDVRGNLVTTAKSKLIAPDEIYRQWWEEQQ
jgi:acyl dehydratase